MKDLNNNEIIQIAGGTDPDGCAGCSAGAAFRQWLSDAWDSLGSIDYVNSTLLGPNGRATY